MTTIQPTKRSQTRIQRLSLRLVSILGCWSSLQTLPTRTSPTTEHLIERVNWSFAQLPRKNLSQVVLSHQLCLDHTLHHNGSNEYRIPHVGKDRLTRLGLLPETMPVPGALKQMIQQLRSPVHAVMVAVEGAPVEE